VYLENLATPIIASRSEEAILRDIVRMLKEGMRIQEHHEVLHEILGAIGDINPLLRSFIRDQGKWDLDRLEERIRNVLRDDEDAR
jgi:hypothetical protein